MLILEDVFEHRLRVNELYWTDPLMLILVASVIAGLLIFLFVYIARRRSIAT